MDEWPDPADPRRTVDGSGVTHPDHDWRELEELATLPECRGCPGNGACRRRAWCAWTRAATTAHSKPTPTHAPVERFGRQPSLFDRNAPARV